MDALFAANPGAFQQMATHISIYHEDITPGYAAMLRDVMRDTTKVRGWDKYTLWRVPGMGGLLGKVAPLDIHGWHVVIDEQEFEKPDRRTTYGNLRYAMLTAAERRKMGGRKMYDFGTMNFSLCVGSLVGAYFVHWSHRKVWFQQRPLARIFGGVVALGVGMAVARQMFKMFAVGIALAERAHHRAVGRVSCVDCLADMAEFTEDQIDELRDARLPDPPPGQPPTSPVMQQRFREGVVQQIQVLRADQQTMRETQRKTLAANGVSMDEQTKDSHTQAVQAGLTPEETADYERKVQRALALKMPPPPLPKPKALARQGVAEAGVEGGIDSTSTPAAGSSAVASGGTVLTPGAQPALLGQENPDRIFVPSLALAPVIAPGTVIPDRCLCEVHRGLRTDPKRYVHPEEFPIFPLDRELAAARIAKPTPAVAAPVDEAAVSKK